MKRAYNPVTAILIAVLIAGFAPTLVWGAKATGKPATKPAKVLKKEAKEKKAYFATPRGTTDKLSRTLTPAMRSPINPQRTSPVAPTSPLVSIQTKVNPVEIQVSGGSEEDRKAAELLSIKLDTIGGKKKVSFADVVYFYPVILGPGNPVWRRRAKPLPPSNIGARRFTARMYGNPIAPTAVMRWPNGPYIGSMYPKQPLTSSDLGLTSATFPTARWRINVRPSIGPLQVHFFPGAGKGYSF